MSSIQTKLELDSKVSEINIGKSFSTNSPIAFHTFRYDFKPASVDTSKVSSVEIGDKNQVTVTVPQYNGAGNSHIVYKGSKRPASKECALIYDHKTGQWTLEKLSCHVQLKKTRLESKSRVQSSRSLSPSDGKKTSPLTVQRPSPLPTASPIMPILSSQTPIKSISTLSESSSSSSGSSSESSSDSDEEEDQTTIDVSTVNSNSMPTFTPQQNPNNSKLSQLSADLELSDSGSE